MIRRLFVAVAVAFFTVGAFTGSPLAVIAATQDYSQSQPDQSYAGQAEYDKKQESADYSYTDEQADQAKAQQKQTSQADAKKQYAQQQSYQNKQ